MSTPTRRRFLATTATASLAPMFLPARAKGANAKLTLGFIGVGKQGESHVRRVSKQLANEVQIIGICDVDQRFRDASANLVKDAYGSTTLVDTYNDYRKLIARPDLDAVLIATPDHWHALTSIHSAAAGKHIYCEKPLSLTIAEAIHMVAAARRFDVTFQTGSMQRSYSNFRFACELVRNGYIGQVKEVIVNVGGPPEDCDLPAEPTPDALDWNFWLGPAPARPFNAVFRPPNNDHFPNWRKYRDYAGGGMTDWGAHHFDIAQWGLGRDGSGPVEIIPPAGPKDALTYIYDDGIKMYHQRRPSDQRSANGVLFIGTEGEVEVNRGFLRTTPDSLKAITLKPSDIHLYNSPDHHRDFLDCIKQHKKPICDVEIGASSVIVCHLGNIAYYLKRPLKWDPKKHVFVNDPEANRLLSRAYREPWSQPV
jgi:predicted dehydrogenase